VKNRLVVTYILKFNNNLANINQCERMKMHSPGARTTISETELNISTVSCTAPTVGILGEITICLGFEFGKCSGDEEILRYQVILQEKI
jgi:hypothetical protein